MVAELADLLDDFPGAANQTCCFLHVINLVVKSIIKQFDLPKAQPNGILNEATKELLALAGDIILEEEESRNNGKDDDEDDDCEGWIDEREEMTEWEREELDESLQLVRLLLTKASRHVTSIRLGFNIAHSSARPPMLSNTRQLSCFLDGTRFLTKSTTTPESCRETSPLDGTQHTTCSCLLSSTARHLILS